MTAMTGSTPGLVHQGCLGQRIGEPHHLLPGLWRDLWPGAPVQGAGDCVSCDSCKVRLGWGLLGCV